MRYWRSLANRTFGLQSTPAPPHAGKERGARRFQQTPLTCGGGHACTAGRLLCPHDSGKHDPS